jgi:biopolymer transport protein ExbD
MTRKNLIFSAMTVLFLSSPSIASAQEVRIQKSDLPAAVQKTADEQSKGATVRGYTMETEGGQLEYEVEMTVNGHSKDVSIDAKGSILEVEEEVTLEKLPAAVREGLQRKAGAGAIKKVESITKHDTVVAYEAKVITNGKKSEVQVGPGGKPLDHEE